jgi:hypothetical protein
MLRQNSGKTPEKKFVEPWQGSLSELLQAWQALGTAAPDEALLRTTRQTADLRGILHVVAAAAVEEAATSGALERALAVQLETVRDRAASWPGALNLDIIAQALDDAIAAKAWPAKTKTLFETLRARVEYVPAVTHAA